MVKSYSVPDHWPWPFTFDAQNWESSQNRAASTKGIRDMKILSPTQNRYNNWDHGRNAGLTGTTAKIEDCSWSIVFTLPVPLLEILIKGWKKDNHRKILRPCCTATIRRNQKLAFTSVPLPTGKHGRERYVDTWTKQLQGNYLSNRTPGSRIRLQGHSALTSLWSTLYSARWILVGAMMVGRLHCKQQMKGNLARCLSSNKHSSANPYKPSTGIYIVHRLQWRRSRELDGDKDANIMTRVLSLY